jgi:dTDP-glucose 4,6-dehydratase
LVRELCLQVDAAFAADASLAARFPAAPPARGTTSDTLIRFVSDRPGHDRRYAIDCDKAASELGFAPRVDIAAGLQQTLGWYLQNEVWWRALVHGA